MTRLLATCVLVAGLLGMAGCNQTASEPSAQAPATDSADRQEVMKPAMDDSPNVTNGEATTEESASEPTTDDDSEETKP